MGGLPAIARERDKLTVLTIGIVAMVASSPAQAFVTALFVDDMLASSSLSRASFSLLFTASAIVSGAGLMWVGRLIDRAPPARVWLIASAGTAGALVVASLVQGPVLVVVAFFLLRLFGMGAFTMLGLLVVSRSFRGNRGKAVAVTILGVTGASMVMPPLAAALIEAVGWRDAYRLMALGVAVLVLPLAIAVRATGVGMPEPAAGRPTGAIPSTAAIRDRRPPSAYPQAFQRTARLPFALPGPRMRRLLLVMSVPSLIVNALLFHATAVLRDHGMSTREAAIAISVQGLASSIGIAITGAVVDRVRTRRALTGTALVLAIAPVVALVPSAPTGYVAYALLGLGGASAGVVGSTVWPRIFGTAQLGRLQGTSAALQTTSAAVGPLPLALSQSVTGGFEAGLVFLAVAGGVGLVAARRWRDPRRLRIRAVAPHAGTHAGAGAVSPPRG